MQRQHNWGDKENILFQILKQIERLTNLTSSSSIQNTDYLSEGTTNLYYTDEKSLNAPGRRGTSTPLDFSLYDDWAITCGTLQQLTIINDEEGVFFKTFELTGGTLHVTNLFTHATKIITETNNTTLANYDPASVNDVTGKFVISSGAIVIDWILKVRE